VARCRAVPGFAAGRRLARRARAPARPRRPRCWRATGSARPARARIAAAPPASLSAFAIDGLEEVSLELYGGFAAARFAGARSGAANRAAEAYEAYLGGLDAELARLWEELPPPRLLAVASAYGVAAPEGMRRLLRSLSSSELELAGTFAGSPAGLLLLAGDDLLAPGQIAEARTVDLVPTLSRRRRADRVTSTAGAD
jgi:hypothetical protein